MKDVGPSNRGCGTGTLFNCGGNNIIPVKLKMIFSTGVLESAGLSSTNHIFSKFSSHQLLLQAYGPQFTYFAVSYLD